LLEDFSAADYCWGFQLISECLAVVHVGVTSTSGHRMQVTAIGLMKALNKSLLSGQWHSGLWASIFALRYKLLRTELAKRATRALADRPFISLCKRTLECADYICLKNSPNEKWFRGRTVHLLMPSPCETAAVSAEYRVQDITPGLYATAVCRIL